MEKRENLQITFAHSYGPYSSLNQPNSRIFSIPPRVGENLDTVLGHLTPNSVFRLINYNFFYLFFIFSLDNFICITTDYESNLNERRAFTVQISMPLDEGNWVLS